MADQNAAREVAGTLTKPRPLPVAETVSRLEAVLSAKGIKACALVGHSGEISYTSPSEPAVRYRLSAELATNRAAVDPVSDAVIEKASD